MTGASLLPISAGRIRVLLAGGQTLLRESLRVALERQGMEVVAEALGGREAVELSDRHRPEVVVMDLGGHADPADLDGLRATQIIVQRQPAVKVVVLASDQSDGLAIKAVKAGARGYLPKTVGIQELVKSLRAVHEGHALFSADVAMQVLEEFRGFPRLASGRGVVELSEREKDILRLLSEGAGNHEIARRLCLSEKTIENRLSVIFQKLNINNRVQAALYALRSGLVPLDPPPAPSSDQPARPGQVGDFPEGDHPEAEGFPSRNVPAASVG